MNGPRAVSDRDQMIRDKGHEVRKEEMVKEERWTRHSPPQSRRGQIELASHLTLRLRAFACNTSGGMHARNDWATAEVF